MISYLKGIVAAKSVDSAIIEVNNIGYELAMSTKTIAELPQTNQSVQIWVYVHVKDDGISFYGFSNLKERDLFKKLISVSSIGPKTALSALSSYSTEELLSAISNADLNILSKIPGIGKKSAQRIVLELQGILQKQEETTEIDNKTQEVNDAMLALESMGFSSTEINKAIQNIDIKDKNSSTLIRLALKNLGGSQ